MNKTMYQKKLQDRTMRHIYANWFVRKVVPTLALETAALTFVALVA
ncbi:MAG: hypothetical protein HY470_01570, partial [Candidatus Ryanbacteria bacterium]|nr:hypothetical protein [Candidatus Ryanbacteria bacterium]